MSGADGEPLVGASVFINGSTQGSVTDGGGVFTLYAPAGGSFEIIASFVGYQTLNYKATTGKIPASLRFELEEKTDEMQSVIIEPIEKNGWQKWGKTFLMSFIGRSVLAEKCTLKNPEVLRFRYNNQSRLLKADATDVIIVENRGLGYNVRYQLELFQLDFSSSMLTVSGYQVFIPITPKNKRQQEKWIEARREAYQGSLPHFIRSAYRKNIASEGFEVRKLRKMTLMDSTKPIISSRRLQGNSPGIRQGIDTARKRVTYASKQVDVLDKNILPDSVFVKKDTSAKYQILDFSDYLHVVYTRELEKEEFATQQFRSRKSLHNPVSLLWLVNSRPVIIQENGLYFDPLELFTSGYWAWERLAESLPYDYQPGD